MDHLQFVDHPEVAMPYSGKRFLQKFSFDFHPGCINLSAFVDITNLMLSG
jgi:hypothetical protein